MQIVLRNKGCKDVEDFDGYKTCNNCGLGFRV